MAEEEIFRINHQLEKMLESSKFDESIVNDLLNVVEETKVTLPILTNTNIGKTVNSLRRVSQNQEINTKAKNLLKKWKQLIPSDKPVASSTGKRVEEQPKVSTNTNKTPPPKETKPDQTKTNVKSTPVEAKKTATPSNLINMKAGPTSDAIRLKCRELLANALSVADIPDGSADPVGLAGRIEDVIFKEFKDTNEKYKNRIRSRVSNLRDLKNPELRKSVLLGLITPDQIAVYSAQEMASKSLREERQTMTKRAIDECQLAQIEATVSGTLKCRKCKQNICSYTEFQTRSADEPMTVFVTCLTCGERWRQ